MRIAFFVGVLVMHAMDGDEEDGASFERECAADGEDIFDPLGRLVASMGEESVVSHPDTGAAGDPP